MAQDEGAAVCGASPFGELRAAAAAALRLLWLFINGNGSFSGVLVVAAEVDEADAAEVAAK